MSESFYLTQETDIADDGYLYTAILDLHRLDQAFESLQNTKTLADTIEQLQVFQDVVSQFGLTTGTSSICRS